mgnify:CR=1 FL=1
MIGRISSPVFVGRGFGNYDDRRSRDDIRYVLTYIEPRVGYEGQVIRDVLDAHRGELVKIDDHVAALPGAVFRGRSGRLDRIGAAQSSRTPGPATAAEPDGALRVKHFSRWAPIAAAKPGRQPLRGDQVRSRLSGRRLGSIFCGGGTTSLMPPAA